MIRRVALKACAASHASSNSHHRSLAPLDPLAPLAPCWSASYLCQSLGTQRSPCKHHWSNATQTTALSSKYGQFDAIRNCPSPRSHQCRHDLECERWPGVSWQDSMGLSQTKMLPSPTALATAAPQEAQRWKLRAIPTALGRTQSPWGLGHGRSLTNTKPSITWYSIART